METQSREKIHRDFNCLESTHLCFFVWLFFAVSLSFSACRQETPLIKASGIVDGETALLIAPVSGEITEFNLAQGKQVTKDEVAVRLDDSLIRTKIQGLEINHRRLNVNQAKTRRQISLLLKNRKYWQDKVERLKKLAASQAVTTDELRQASLQLEQVEAELEINYRTLESLRLEQAAIENQREELELQLKDFAVASPATGVVLETFVTPRERVLVGKTMARILVEGSLFIEAFLEESELSRIQLNQEASFEIDGLPG